MTRAEFNAMFIKEDGTWNTEAYLKHEAENDAKRIERINNELDSVKMAYRVKDTEDNTFTYQGLATGGFPLYRCAGGTTHLFNMNGLTIIQQYA